MEADRTAVRIFDLVNANKIGQAEGALETALAKYPGNDSLQAAEALVLLRQDQPERAKARALELSKRTIKEPKAINALVHVLQQCCCWEALAATYERLRPLQDDKQIGENLLQTYVRMGNYTQAQQLATQLYRTHADPKYQVWMVQACLGQVPPGSTDHLMLKVSTKLLHASVLTEKGVVTPATVRVYVDALVQQELYADAITFLCSERGAKIGLLETRLEVLAGVLRKQGRLTLANAAARKLWTMHPDNWTPFEVYADTITSDTLDEDAAATLTLAAQSEELRATLSGADGDHSLDAALTLARTLQEAQKESKKPMRGPFLAELVLLDRKGDREGLEDVVLAYVQRFYRKPCCFLDISTFLSQTSADKVYAWSKAEGDGNGHVPAEGASEADKIAAHTRSILGLRCHVASWGITADTMPSVDEIKALMEKCLSTYIAAKPLSTSLEWNEEGHCDAYISIALNAALHAYEAYGKDRTWIIAAFSLMRDVDRRMNNSAWLIYGACFASLLGLTDTAAHHQLAFKSVQHDTMSHLGYWPLVRGLARDDIAEWDCASMGYYGHVERDCSLLRAKVFTFASWPAMQDVQRFQAAQENSLARWLSCPQACAGLLAECQTQKNIFALFEHQGPELWHAWEALGSATAASDLQDNTDWTVARSVVLGNIHSDKVKTLTDTLVSMPSRDARLARGCQLVCSLLLLADIAAVEQQRHAARNAPKPRKAKKGATATGEDGNALEGASPVLYTARLTEGGAKPERLACLPAVAPLARALLPSLTGKTQSDNTAGATAATEAFSAHLQGLLACSTAEAFESFLNPEAYLLAALVRIVPLSAAPATTWAAMLHTTLEAAIQKYEKEWYFTAGDAAVAHGAAADPFTGTLVHEKAKRVRAYVADLLVDVAASARRK